ncbi:pyridine nucleotide-disulfide oxidoreductase-domain-containing protein [Lipomyces tetrasporus]|uniref:Pyridine nucleotide-disulfide oxidoreductase-domain-containing protein n=1 Tax=Lipomyces tetrasporus TaxID=54092 RepID=A0AAD7VTY7_9ASCO|nr:pyridine nucleotide-disulfide oxidoreductase-domain-containing protein [Lipomyces tetrasporus]KAJ8101244.1 pyridine nucleotide-disulfide oxidoreductase-domain-containing protein [Lipomyces tetrasporus]
MFILSRVLARSLTGCPPSRTATRHIGVRRMSAAVQIREAESQGYRNKQMPRLAKDHRQTVVILGSGWAGYNLLRHLNSRYYRCIVVSPRSYFVFTPLLASTAVGTLETRVAIESVRDKGLGWRKLADVLDDAIRRINVAMKRKDVKAIDNNLPTVELVEGIATDIDIKSKTVTVSPRISAVDPNETFDIQYDKLAIAVGCHSQTFNIKGVTEQAFFLKDVGDARRIRKRVLERFEAANLFLVSEEHKSDLLHFCIVGGGPTGVEFAAELHDLIKDDMQLYYPSLMPYVQITIFDVAKNILGTFDKSLSEYAEQHFRRHNIEIRTGVMVQEVTEHSLRIKNSGGEDETVNYGLLVWSTGLAPNPFVAGSDVVVKDKRNNIVTDGYLNVYAKDSKGKALLNKDVFALGDCAQIDDGYLPATAQVASQKALYLSKELNKEAKGKADVEHKPFVFNNRGIMAYIGGWRAVVQGNSGEVKGRTAWLLWRGAYFSMSVSIKNKILIPIYWFTNWLFGRDISRF